MRPVIEHLFIDEPSRGAPLANRIMEAFPQAQIHTLPDRSPERFTGLPAGARSSTLCITRYRGSFIKPFPTHPWYQNDAGGCGHTLLIGYNCCAACRYCFTRTYFEDPYPTLFSNVDEMLEALDAFLSTFPDGAVSTGEFTDSFLLDEITGTNQRLFDLLAGHPAARLELRTKSGRIAHLPAAGGENSIIAWSINPPAIIESTESGTAGFSERLASARLLREKGYRIALRIDPVIMAKEYADAYGELPGRIEEELGWRNVSELHLGAIRFDKRMMGALGRRRVSDRLLDAQYILCPDGKYRPHKYVRIEFFRSIIQGIRRHAPKLPLHLSMEPAYVHRAVLPHPDQSQSQ